MRTASRLSWVTALAIFILISIPADWSQFLKEPALTVFFLVVALVQAAPFMLLAWFLTRRTTHKKGPIIVMTLVMVLEVALYGAVLLSLDQDAQNGLLYIFFTPLVTYVVAAITFVAIARMTSPAVITPPAE